MTKHPTLEQEHETRVAIGTLLTYWAECTCGWRGGCWGRATEAEDEANYHEQYPNQSDTP